MSGWQLSPLLNHRAFANASKFRSSVRSAVSKRQFLSTLRKGVLSIADRVSSQDAHQISSSKYLSLSLSHE
jgi:hypothetical protein